MRLSSGFDLMASPFHLLIDLMLIIVRNSKEPITKLWVWHVPVDILWGESGHLDHQVDLSLMGLEIEVVDGDIWVRVSRVMRVPWKLSNSSTYKTGWSKLFQTWKILNYVKKRFGFQFLFFKVWFIFRKLDFSIEITVEFSFQFKCILKFFLKIYPKKKTDLFELK